MSCHARLGRLVVLCLCLLEWLNRSQEQQQPAAWYNCCQVISSRHKPTARLEVVLVPRAALLHLSLA
eukprot:m.98772 g.98772  ORF g.98772 m.98772 type:complete len:67 (-) comp15295_c1_seq1:49-249(-)